MTAVTASIIVFALYALVLAPVIWVVAGKSGRVVAPVAAVVVIAVLVYNTGLFQRDALAQTDITVPSVFSSADEECRKIRDLMRESGLRVDLSQPDRPRILGPGAEQIPSEVSTVLIQCFVSDRNSGVRQAGPQ